MINEYDILSLIEVCLALRNLYLEHGDNVTIGGVCAALGLPPEYEAAVTDREYSQLADGGDGARVVDSIPVYVTTGQPVFLWLDEDGNVDA